MEKISVSNVVEFRRKSTKSQDTFVNNLKRPKQDDPSGGGNYWVTSVSAVSKFYGSGDNEIILDKLNELLEKFGRATATTSKKMYQKNIEILHNFEDFDFAKMKPEKGFSIVSRRNNKSIILIKGIPVQITPNHVFTFTENENEKVGAILFVAKKDGYSVEEIAIFTDVLYRYVKLNYSPKHEISKRYCIVLDVVNLKNGKYEQVENNNINSLLESTLESIKKLL